MAFGQFHHRRRLEAAREDHPAPQVRRIVSHITCDGELGRFHRDRLRHRFAVEHVFQHPRQSAQIGFRRHRRATQPDGRGHAPLFAEEVGHVRRGASELACVGRHRLGQDCDWVGRSERRLFQLDGCCLAPSGLRHQAFIQEKEHLARRQGVVLVFLKGHVIIHDGRNRLEVFAREPATVDLVTV